MKLTDSGSSITYNQANQMLTLNDKSMIYDDNGNLTSVTNACGTTTYTWDARNRLVAINGFTSALTSTLTCEALSASFKYDALGRRIGKTINGRTIQYLYDGLDIVQEIEGGQVAVNYIRTLNIDEPLARVESSGVVRYYQQDALGSVIALNDETGNIRTQYIYDPFGNVTITGEASDNPFQYTGRENDLSAVAQAGGTGLYYYRARYYSPELQRFISEDPIGFEGGDVNFYAYVANNPINYVDPLGTAVIAIPIAVYAGRALLAAGTAYLYTPAGQEALRSFFKTIEDLIREINEEKERAKSYRCETREPWVPHDIDPNKPPEDPRFKWKYALIQLLKLVSKWFNPGQ